MSVLVFLAAATAMPPPPPAVAEEIVVIARKAKEWKGGVSKVGGRMICKTGKSSGDKAIDAINCGAMLTCLKPLEPRIDALMTSAQSTADKRRGFNAILSGITPCMKTYADSATERLARERVGA